MTEDEMVGWHSRLNGHEFEKTLGDSVGQRSLVCCSPWDCKESDMTEQLNNNLTTFRQFKYFYVARKPSFSPLKLIDLDAIFYLA